MPSIDAAGDAGELQTPDLLGTLAAAFVRTREELNALDDLTEQLQADAGVLIAYAKRRRRVDPEDVQKLEQAADQLAAWQLSEARHENARVRAKARGLLDQLAARGLAEQLAAAEIPAAAPAPA